MNNVERIRYSKVRNSFRVESKGRGHVIPAPLWNAFLNRYGRQQEVHLENRVGSINVDKEAFEKMLYSRKINMTINLEVTELIKSLSKEITDLNYDAPADDYLKQINRKVEKLQKRLDFFQRQRNFDNEVETKPLMDWTV